MSRVILVRHGRAAAGWDADADPGLDDVGRAQAAVMTDAVAPLGPLPIVVSPLRRARETAAPLEQRWGVTARVDAAVGEIPSPSDDLTARGEWLRRALRGTWSDLPSDYDDWRSDLLDALLGMDEDTIVVTHFVAINAAVGRATDDDRLVCAGLDNCSRTVFDVENGVLRLVELGAQAATVIR